jgi:hypothetical protein
MTSPFRMLRAFAAVAVCSAVLSAAPASAQPAPQWRINRRASHPECPVRLPPEDSACATPARLDRYGLFGCEYVDARNRRNVRVCSCVTPDGGARWSCVEPG